jgi:hypothetical protein
MLKVSNKRRDLYRMVKLNIEEVIEVWRYYFSNWLGEFPSGEPLNVFFSPDPPSRSVWHFI